jgi:TetR/AcrR family transcriptional repressor of nem operon
MPRPKSFDPETKLRDAMQLFWQVGFDGASIPRLEGHLGINRFSIYDTFGKKRDLFIRALDLYATELLQELMIPLESGTEGLGDLRRFFVAWRRYFVDDQIRGCLMCNTATELGDSDPEISKRVNAYFDRLEQAVLSSLKRARELGEVAGDDVGLSARATAIRLAIQGALVTFAASPTPTEATRIVEALSALSMGSARE